MFVHQAVECFGHFVQKRRCFGATLEHLRFFDMNIVYCDIEYPAKHAHESDKTWFATLFVGNGVTGVQCRCQFQKSLMRQHPPKRRRGRFTGRTHTGRWLRNYLNQLDLRIDQFQRLVKIYTFGRIFFSPCSRVPVARHEVRRGRNTGNEAYPLRIVHLRSPW